MGARFLCSRRKDPGILLPDPVDEKGNEEKHSDKKSVNRELVVFQQSLRFFQGFFFFERFPKNQEKIGKDKRREIYKSLELVRNGETEISDKEEYRAQDDSED